MNIKYNKELIERLLFDLSAITGASFAFYDNAETPTLVYVKEKNEDAFCHYINSFPEGGNRCKCSDEELIRKCRQSGKTVSHVCHAGLLDTAVPLIVDGVYVGCVIIGRVRRCENFSDIAENLNWLGEKNERCRESYSNLSYLTVEQIGSLSNLISSLIFGSAIIFDHESSAEDAAPFIENNLRENLTVEILCKRLYMTKNKLYTLFKNNFDCTVNEYICNKRILKAKEYLSKTNLTIRDIAEVIGIPNYTYFQKLFKKKVGASPKEYRCKNRI